MGAKLAALEALAEGKLLEESDPVDQYDTVEVPQGLARCGLGALVI